MADKVGFIGPGQMGMPMVIRMASAGIDLKVCARRAEVAAELTKLGVNVVGTPREAAEGVDLLIVCLYSDSQLREALFDQGSLGAMKAGSILASHVTGSPKLIDELQSHAPTGVTIVDAPVSGTADQILAGKLSVMLGCDKALVEPISRVMATYSDPIMHIGDRGDALKVKLVNNILFAANLQLAGAAQALGDSLGIDRTLLANTLANCSGASRAVAIVGGHPFAAMEGGARPYLEKDVTVVAEIANELGLDLGLLGETARSYNKIGQPKIGTEPDGH